MSDLDHLFAQNRLWAQQRQREDENIFLKQAEGQSPQYLWIGCSDSRIPAAEILGLQPGDLFVHRNIANLFPRSDFNCLSVLQYAVEYLKVKHVIVCGHYGCGGVAASMEKDQFGIVDNWLVNIRDVYARHQKELDSIQDHELRNQRLVELNTMSQVMNVAQTTPTQNAWKEGASLTIHGWVYDLKTGLVKDLQCSVSSLEQLHPCHRTVGTESAP